MVGWNSSMPDDEATPIMHPVRMELAPHARLGRRMAASTAIFVLLVFHCSMIAVGVLNMNADCSENLWLFLVIYGGVGLLFVYLLFREWLYYARLSSLPSLFNLVLLIIFYACLSTAGGFLVVRTRTTPRYQPRACTRTRRTTAPFFLWPPFLRRPFRRLRCSPPRKSRGGGGGDQGVRAPRLHAPTRSPPPTPHPPSRSTTPCSRATRA